eukprot:5597874-Lingulodinium_polyedra.AAC.1
MRRGDKPNAQVPPLRADVLGSERAVCHGDAPAAEAVLGDDLGLESATAGVGGGVDVLAPLATGNV